MLDGAEKERKAQTHHKCVMGGLVAKYFPECYRFEEGELNRIIRAAIQSEVCQGVIGEIKRECERGGGVSHDGVPKAGGSISFNGIPEAGGGVPNGGVPQSGGAGIGGSYGGVPQPDRPQTGG